MLDPRSVALLERYLEARVRLRPVHMPVRVSRAAAAHPAARPQGAHITIAGEEPVPDISYTIPHNRLVSCRIPLEGLLHPLSGLTDAHRTALVLDWTLAPLLTCVSVDSIMIALGCLLAEAKVVVAGREAGAVSAVVLGLAALLYPLRWTFPLIPILPRQLAEFLEVRGRCEGSRGGAYSRGAGQAPFPLLAGTLYTPDALQSSGETLVLNLADNTVRALAARAAAGARAAAAAALALTLLPARTMAVEAGRRRHWRTAQVQVPGLRSPLPRAAPAAAQRAWAVRGARSRARRQRECAASRQVAAAACWYVCHTAGALQRVTPVAPAACRPAGPAGAAA